MKLIATFILSLPLLFSPWVFAQDLDEILSKMQKADSSIQYQGTLTTVLINTPFTKISRYKVSNYGNFCRREELLSNGINKEINFDDGKYLWRFFPHKNLVIKEKSRKMRLLQYQVKENLELVKQNYHIQIVEEYTINKRPGHKILFRPKTADRPKQLFWIDKKTGVPFKIEKYGIDNKLVSVSSFSAIDFNKPFRQKKLCLKVPPQTCVTEINEKGNLTISEAKRLMGGQVLMPEYLPFGFKLKNIILRTKRKTKILQLFYTDGLSSLSIFQRQFIQYKRKKIPQFIKIKLGGDEAFFNTSGSLNRLKIRSQPISTTLMGEICKEEMIKIGRSLTLGKLHPPFGMPATTPKK